MAGEASRGNLAGSMGAGVAIGVGVRATFGVALDNLGVGMAIGAVIGVLLGLAMSRARGSGG